MAPQAFELHDGSLTVKVNGNGDTILVDFDITDSSHASPVIDMEKFERARRHVEAIRAAILALNPAASVSEVDAALKGNSHLELSAAMGAAHYDDAIAAIRAQIEPVRATTQDIPPSPQNSSFLQRLRQEGRRAIARETLKDWALDDFAAGMSGSVFVTDQSILSGKPADVGHKLIAVKIIPGGDTRDARHETHHFTAQVETRLRARGLHIKSSEVYLGADASGRQDTGIILIHTGEQVLRDMEKTGEVMDEFQQEHHVFRQKLGTRHRGEDHRHRAKREKSALEAQLELSVRGALESGLLQLKGTPRALRSWVEDTARKLESAQGEDIDPTQRRTGTR